MRYFLWTQYDGTAFHGWQVQPNAHTVQAELQAKLSILLGEPVAVVGSGRTDTGVHAEAQWVHMDTDVSIPPDFVYRMNCLLPDSVSVWGIYAPQNAQLHARFSAVQRGYRYSIARQKQPLLRNHTLLHTSDLDGEAMQQAASLLLFHKDFACFCKAGGNQHTTICTITEATWVFGENRWDFHIRADRFLRGMVRAIVGTLLEVGKGKLTLVDFQAILDSGDRKQAGKAVAAQGLSLCQVRYEAGALLPLQGSPPVD